MKLSHQREGKETVSCNINAFPPPKNFFFPQNGYVEDFCFIPLWDGE